MAIHERAGLRVAHNRGCAAGAFIDSLYDKEAEVDREDSSQAVH